MFSTLLLSIAIEHEAMTYKHVMKDNLIYHGIVKRRYYHFHCINIALCIHHEFKLCNLALLSEVIAFFFYFF